MKIRTTLFLAFSLLTAACEESKVCGEGTVERDGQCAPVAAAPAAFQVRLTHLGVKYDLSQPVYVNNRVPISFGLTAKSVDPANPTTRQVAVTFSFVEANPADPANPLSCGSSAITVEVNGDGTEQLFNSFIWPTTVCAELAAKNAGVNLQVEFDGGTELAAEVAPEIDAPSVVFSEARRGDALNQGCRAALEGADPGLGCVHDIRLQPTPADSNGPLIDIRYGLSASSSVAVLPAQPAQGAGPAAVVPALVVQSHLVVNGRDPYISAVDPALLPAELLAADPSIAEELKFGLGDAALAALDALPGKASVSYTLRSAADGATALPLTIAAASDPANRVAEAVIERVVPGTANDFAHELYFEGATLAALAPGGMWADQSNFVVRGCFNAEFPQSGNAGDGATDDCREIEVMIVRDGAAASAASSLSFDKSFERKLGGDRIAIDSSMSTQNRLDLSGASSKIEGKVQLKGKIGKSFSLTLASAFGNANLGVDPTKNSFELGVDAFGQRIFEFSKSSEPKIVHTDDFSVAKSFKLGGLGFGFGPVTVGISIGVGGTIGFETEDTLEALTDNESCQTLLKSTETISLCGRMTRVSAPKFALTGNLTGGIDLKIVKAAVVADLEFATTRFPLDTTLGFGFTEDKRLLVRGDATWDMEFTPLSGNVSIVGKVGFKKFAKSLKVNLFSFSSPTFNKQLMSVSMGSFQELQ